MFDVAACGRRSVANQNIGREEVHVKNNSPNSRWRPQFFADMIIANDDQNVSTELAAIQDE
ncbi:MAG TPA: hypothetical protein VGX78_12165 [Pirellulales bacterium]|nr:hypothetical protein [Pirellulales bacterium]